jgi:hypothetical protein
MAELQQGLWIVKTEERYEPTFSYRWDLLEAWLPDAVVEGRRLARGLAVERLVERYLRGAVFAREAVVTRLLGLGRDDAGRALASLVKAGQVVAGREIAGWPGRWIVHRSALRARPG